MIITGDATQFNSIEFPHRYGVIVADPPWPYRVSKGQGTAKDQYDLMTDENIYAINPPAALDSVLFLWGTWPKLPEALKTLKAWGFDYVTGFPWVKLNREDRNVFYGVGFWVRGCSEYILIGKRGNVSPPRMEGFLGLMSPNLQHSRKPDSIHEIAETLPGPYLELFGRRSRPGWTVFGNEVEDITTGQVVTDKGTQNPIQTRF